LRWSIPVIPATLDDSSLRVAWAKNIQILSKKITNAKKGLGAWLKALASMRA
jgi:hypothetical protein